MMHPITNRRISRAKYEADQLTYAKHLDEMRAKEVLTVHGVCKDCGNGTLNNTLNEAFDFNGNGYYCLNCGSTHLDIL
jgi:hypothetical protein